MIYICEFNLNVTFCRETAIVREEGESPNDRNDRGQSIFAISERIG